MLRQLLPQRLPHPSRLPQSSSILVLSLSGGQISVLGGSGKPLSLQRSKKFVGSSKLFATVGVNFAESYCGCEQRLLGCFLQLLYQNFGDDLRRVRHFRLLTQHTRGKLANWQIPPNQHQIFLFFSPFQRNANISSVLVQTYLRTIAMSILCFTCR